MSDKVADKSEDKKRDALHREGGLSFYLLIASHLQATNKEMYDKLMSSPLVSVTHITKPFR